MDKKQFIWILLACFMGTLLVQRFLLPSKEDDTKTSETTSEPTQRPAESVRFIYDGAFLSPDEAKSGSANPLHLGSVDPDSGYKLKLELDSRGAAVRTAKLTGYYNTVEQKRNASEPDADLEGTSYTVLNPVQDRSSNRVVLPFSTHGLLIDGAMVGTFHSPRVALADDPGTQGHFAWGGKGDQPATFEPVMDAGVEIGQRVSFVLELLDSDYTLQYRLTKTYTLLKGSNSFRMSLEVENHTGIEKELSVVQYGPTGLPREDVRNDIRDVVVAAYIGEDREIAIPEDGKIKLTDAIEEGDVQSLGSNADADPAVWVGATNKFFGCLMYPIPASLIPAPTDAAPAVSLNVDEDTPVADLVVPTDQSHFKFTTEVVGNGDDDAKSQLVLLTTDPVTVSADAPLALDFDVFCGPKDNTLFDKTPLYSKLEYTNSITFTACNMCLVEFLVHGVMWIIAAGGAALGNYGVIIIILVLVIRLALHPITKRSQTSMMKMKKLQPQMQAIQEKHKDNKEAQQKAMMEFWKKTGFSPVLGCLPMLLQMPIWMALWAGLSASVVLRHEGLLPFWITDLAAPDTVWAFGPVMIPLLGKMIGPIHGLNLLPLLLTVFMFLQQKLTPMQSSAPSTNPDQAKQQKMMMYMMSGMMLLIFYNAPSGLTLYIMASTAGGLIESYFIRKHIRQKEEEEEAREIRVSAPGKVARDRRPKKPKPPFKM